MAKAYDELEGYYYGKIGYGTSPCKTNPERCEPRHIKHVSFDADGVLWHIGNGGGIASSARGPFKLLDDNTLVTSEGSESEPLEEDTGQFEEEDEKVRQHEFDYDEGKQPSRKKLSEIMWDPKNNAWYEKAYTDTGLSWLLMPLRDAPKPPSDPSVEQRRYVRLPVSWKVEQPPKIAKKLKSVSHYEPKRLKIELLPTLRQTLDELEKRGIKMTVISLNTPGSVKGILKGFDLLDKFTEVRDSWENKGKVFSELTQKYHLPPCDSIFIDDTMSNVQDVAAKCGLALHMGSDIKKPIEIMNYILPKEE